MAHEVLVKGVPVALKYCTVCDFRRPPRTSHCRETDRCIDKWDHYCPWVGNAVGRRNYPHFVLFITTTCVLAGHTAVGCAAQLRLLWVALAAESGRSSGVLHLAARAPLCCLLLLYTAIATVLLAVLSIYHCYLVSINQTTYENVRGAFSGTVNPFDNGFCANWAEAFCFRCREPTRAGGAAHNDEEAWGMLAQGGPTAADDGAGGGGSDHHLPLSRAGAVELAAVAEMGGLGAPHQKPHLRAEGDDVIAEPHAPDEAVALPLGEAPPSPPGAPSTPRNGDRAGADDVDPHGADGEERAPVLHSRD
mmetsp:Transcript_50474/g.139768  ORF Transcript_50474/g.139768 Transcript_50474/m.139768 type:complete len:306 (-) Transcript_50474:196-1113(-)